MDTRLKRLLAGPLVGFALILSAFGCGRFGVDLLDLAESNSLANPQDTASSSLADVDTDTGPGDTQSASDVDSDTGPGVDSDTGSGVGQLPQFTHRSPISVSSTEVAGAGLSYFPVLISDTQNNWRDTLNGGNVTQDDGGDIVFTGADGVTQLDHEISLYEPDTGRLVVWVEMPYLSGSVATSLYMYYGSTDPADQWDETGTWDEGGSSAFRGVWHIDEGGVGTRFDSTQYGNHCTPSGYDGNEDVTGAVLGADDLEGSNDHLNCGNSASLNPTSGLTLEGWVMYTQYPSKDDWYYVASKPNFGMLLYNTSAENFDVLGYDFLIGGIQQFDFSATGTLVDNTKWSYVAVTFDGTSLSTYVDGDLVVTHSHPGSIDDSAAQDLLIGAGTGGYHYDGRIDEVRISSVARSADWLATCFNNYSDPGSFLTILTEEAL